VAVRDTKCSTSAWNIFPASFANVVTTDLDVLHVSESAGCECACHGPLQPEWNHMSDQSGRSSNKEPHWRKRGQREAGA
jgi:hypothetical protein